MVAPLAGSVDRNLGHPVARPGRHGSLPSRGAWIEIRMRSCAAPRTGSLPSRGAWIEMLEYRPLSLNHSVAPLAGSVDRNDLQIAHSQRAGAVAPLAGSVDRNPQSARRCLCRSPSLPSRGAWIEMCSRPPTSGPRPVAPLAGSVDRNTSAASAQEKARASLPSRGAWIEITGSTSANSW